MQPSTSTAAVLGIAWLVSCWDEASVDFIEQFDPPCYKIASASLTDDALLRHHRQYGRPIILSTGMSDLEEIDHAVDVLGKDNLVLMHATSTYPTQAAGVEPSRRFAHSRELTAFRSDTPDTRSGSQRPSRRGLSALAQSNATSRSIARCGVPTSRHPSSRSDSIA